MFGESITGSGVSGHSQRQIGVFGLSDSDTGIFGRGPKFAGFFDGNVGVTGTLTVAGTEIGALVRRVSSLEQSAATQHNLELVAQQLSLQIAALQQAVLALQTRLANAGL